MLNLKDYYKPVCSFLLTLIILSCTQENFKTNTISPDTQVIPLKEAVSTLDKLLGDIYGATKAGPSYNIDEAVVFGGITTKSGEITLPDSSVYIINFNDSNGFALLAAQKNMITPVFCITESGSLSEEDLCNALEKLEQETSSLTKSDDGDEEYFASTGEQFVPTLLAASMINQMSGAPGSGGDGGPGEVEDIFIPDEDPGTGGGQIVTYSYQTVTNIGPILETKWKQDGPFNNFLPTDRIPAGCVAIAAAQILAHNEYENYNDRSFDWDLMKTVCHYTNYTDTGSVAA